MGVVTKELGGKRRMGVVGEALEDRAGMREMEKELGSKKSMSVEGQELRSERSMGVVG